MNRDVQALILATIAGIALILVYAVLDGAR